jgi:hypothetical protein
MNCADVQEDIVRWTLGELTESQRRRFEAHLAECAACSTECDAVRRDIDLLYRSLGNSSRDEVLGEAITSQVLSPTQVQAPPAFYHSLPACMVYLLSLAAGIMIALFIPQPVLQSGAEDAPDMSGEVALDPSLETSRENTESSDAGIMFVAATTRDFRPEARFQILYDPGTRELHFFCQNFSPAMADQMYVLAGEDEEGRIQELGRFEVDAFGKGRTVVSGVTYDQARQVTVLLKPEQPIRDDV